MTFEPTPTNSPSSTTTPDIKIPAPGTPGGPLFYMTTMEAWAKASALLQEAQKLAASDDKNDHSKASIKTRVAEGIVRYASAREHLA